jgi:hypothetical protein
MTARVALPQEISLDTSGEAPVLRLKQPSWKVLTLPPSEATTWVLPNTPMSESLDLARNGLVLTEGIDYTLTGDTITLTGSPHAPTDTWRVKYQV